MVKTIAVADLAIAVTMALSTEREPAEPDHGIMVPIAAMRYTTIVARPLP